AADRRSCAKGYWLGAPLAIGSSATESLLIEGSSSLVVGPNGVLRVLALGGPQDGSALGQLEEDGGLQRRIGGGRQGEVGVRRPGAQPDQLFDDVPVRQGLAAVLAALDRHLRQARVVAHQPDVGRRRRGARADL